LFIIPIGNKGANYVVLQRLLAFLEDQPTSYLDEMQDFLLDEFDIKVSISTIYRVLKKNNWSRKSVRRRAAQRSESLRSAWIGRLIM
jgi:transposase